MDKSVIYIKEIINSQNAVTTQEGDTVYKVIEELFDKDKEVHLDFQGVNLIISTFLNASIGQIYGKYSTAFIQNHLSVENMSNDDLLILKKVVDRAKTYFNDKNNFEANYKNNFPNAE